MKVILLRLLGLIVCVCLVVYGHSQGTSYLNLGLMIVGLAGLLGLLYEYNRKYQ